MLAPCAQDGRRAFMPLVSIGEPRVLLDGFGMGESPRWHDGRLWFSSWGTDEIVAVDLDGNAEVMGRGGGGSGWAVNWLPDGGMLVTGPELIRVESGKHVRHADLGDILPYGCSEITIDGRGNAYVKDRKSTRLNSSHTVSSYAVFC